MRFWSSITYSLVAAGLVACSVYDKSLLQEDNGGPPVLNASGNNGTTTTSSASGTPTTTTVGNPTSTTVGSGSGSGSGGGSGGDGDGGTGGAATTTGADGGNGGTTDASQTMTTTDSGSGGTTTTTTDTGSGGTGGTTTVDPPDPTLLDDMEDGDNQLKRPLYSGYWYTAVDETGSGDVTPAPGSMADATDLAVPRNDSMRAMHVSGNWSGGDDWAAALGFAFFDDEGALGANSFTGISFYAKTDEPMTQVEVQLMLSTVADSGHYSTDITSLLSADWQLITINFSAAGTTLIQPSWADEVTFDPTKLFKVQFQFGDGDFDLWIDDIRFLE